MGGEADDHVKIDAASLASSLRKSMPKNFSFSKKCCIFKIPNILRRHNPDAFVPYAFSIGPWHHDQGEHLKPAEEIKLNYLRRLISRFPERMLLEELIQAIGEIEEDVRAHYAGPIEMSVDDFVMLLVIDGCFIIEVFRKKYYKNRIPSPYSNDEYDPIFHMSCMFSYLFHDLILLENQIPWMVLQLLFNKTMEPGSRSLEHLGIKFFRYMFSMTAPPLIDSYQGKYHILDLLREWLVSLSTEEGDAEEVAFLRIVAFFRIAAFLRIVTFLRTAFLRVIAFLFATFLSVAFLRSAFVHVAAFLRAAFVHITAFLRVVAFFRVAKKRDVNEGDLVWQPMPSTQSLKEAGIEFKKRKSKSILDVKFVDGVLEVPSLLIHEATEDIFRNLISFEQCYSECPARITSYALLLDSLINTEKDLKILCEEGIVENWLNPTIATQFFNELYHDAFLKDCYYLDLCKEVKTYCSHRWPRWRAVYMHNYFGTPWAIASQVVAAVILILTFLQTLFSIIKD